MAHGLGRTDCEKESKKWEACEKTVQLHLVTVSEGESNKLIDCAEEEDRVMGAKRRKMKKCSKIELSEQREKGKRGFKGAIVCS